MLILFHFFSPLHKHLCNIILWYNKALHMRLYHEDQLQIFEENNEIGNKASNKTPLGSI